LSPKFLEGQGFLQKGHDVSALQQCVYRKRKKSPKGDRSKTIGWKRGLKIISCFGRCESVNRQVKAKGTAGLKIFSRAKEDRFVNRTREGTGGDPKKAQPVTSKKKERGHIFNGKGTIRGGGPSGPLPLRASSALWEFTVPIATLKKPIDPSAQAMAKNLGANETFNFGGNAKKRRS